MSTAIVPMGCTGLNAIRLCHQHQCAEAAEITSCYIENSQRRGPLASAFTSVQGTARKLASEMHAFGECASKLHAPTERASKIHASDDMH